VKDFVVGFSHSLANFNRGPENVFIKKSFKTGDAGELSLDADYSTTDNLFTLATSWAHDRVKVGLNLFSKLPVVSDVSVSSNFDINSVSVGVSGDYDVTNNKFTGSTSVTKGDTTFKLDGDSVSVDPKLTITQVVDASNSVAPSISLKSGSLKYGWTRKWDGGSLTSTYTPNDSIKLDWKDSGVNGQWRTEATIPVDDAKGTKVSISRDWKL